MDEKSTTTATPVATASNNNVIAVVTWFFAPLTSILFLILDNYKKDKFIQFHAFESLIFSIVGIVLNSLLGWTCIVPIAYLVVWIMAMVKAYKGEMWKMPIIGDMAMQQAEKAANAPSAPKA